MVLVVTAMVTSVRCFLGKIFTFDNETRF